MKYNRICKLAGMAVCVWSAVFADNVHAQAAGSTTAAIGWLHVMPQSSSDPVLVQSVGGMPVNQSLAGTGAHADSADTVSLMIEHMFTDHVGVALLAGTPFTDNLTGDGSFAQYGVIGKAKPMAPVLELRYHFLPAGAKFRPYAGAGVNYTWYSDTHIANDRFLDSTCGPGCTSTASLSSSWNPTFDIGFSYALTKHLGIDASVTYIPMSTTLTTKARTATGINTVTKLHIGTNPLITHLDLTYTF